MKKTPLFERHVRDGGKMVEFAGYQMPIQFSSIIEEHKQVREKVGVFDVSHMGEIWIFGEEATEFLDYLLTNSIYKMQKMTCMYTIMCYENGTTVDDLIVYKYDDQKYLLVVNASNDSKDYEWIKVQSQTFKVTVVSASLDFGEIAVQGPAAETVLADLLGDLVKTLGFFTFTELFYKNIPIIISRTGYTGEDGFEIFTHWNDLEVFYSLLFESAPEQLRPIGLGARDTLRFEASLPLYGHELSDSITPIEAKLDMFVDLNKPSFIGRTALFETKSAENPRCLAGFMLDDKGIAREGYSILNADDEVIGHVTTGYMLDTFEHSIGLCLIPKVYAKLGEKIYVQVRKSKISATVIKRKFYQKKYKK